MTTSNEYVDVTIIGCSLDVGDSLMQPIYDNITSHGPRVFKVCDATINSDMIDNAIRSSVALVIIFSLNFGNSPSKLGVLPTVLKLKTNPLFIPVYYDVEPWHLRYVQKGVYAPAFLQYEQDPEQKYTDFVLSDWKDALSQISFLYGLELNSKKFKGDTSKLVDAVVGKVLANLRKETLEVAKYPVALEETLQDYKSSVEKHSQDVIYKAKEVNIAGIVGMPGSGKTTLSKAIYNDMLPSFTRSSFLFNVKETSDMYGLIRLQRRLIKDLLNEKLRIVTPLEGKEFLRDRLTGLRVLIVLDDISHEDQLDCLLPRDVIHPGSCIVITSRDKGVLKRAEITNFYYMKVLIDKHAEELFCASAFGQCHPMDTYEKYVKQFLKICGGLPLSLKVIGDHMFGKYVEGYWEHEADIFTKLLHGEIRSAVKLLYDSLEEEEKILFVSLAACDHAELGTYSARNDDLSRLQKLEDKCLIEISKNEIKVHNQIQIFAREITNSQDHANLNSQKDVPITTEEVKARSQLSKQESQPNLKKERKKSRRLQ